MGNDELRAKLFEQAARLPLLPGVYLMKDKNNRIIYIGKAKKLKNRVSQYFAPYSQHDLKTSRLLQSVKDFDYIVTTNEMEALVLECSLIKQYSPKYNILLKDDKGYNYLKITDQEWPRLMAAKQLDNQGEFIGPFPGSFSVKQTVDEANRVFGLPDCRKRFSEDIGKGRPCLNYHINRCSGICRGKISRSDYVELINQAVSYIKNGSTHSIEQLTAQMEKAAEELRFEKAAKIRDRINAIKKIAQEQNVYNTSIRECDVIALAVSEGNILFELLHFRQGRLISSEYYMDQAGENHAESRAEFIRLYYSKTTDIPARILIDGECSDRGLIEEYLSDLSNRRVRIIRPLKGEQARLVNIAMVNAREHLIYELNLTGTRVSREHMVLEELAGLLGLDNTPEYIESYDISNISSSAMVAGMVVFKDGKPYKKAYKRFRIKNQEVQDDYRAMREVIERRFARYKQTGDGSSEGFGRLPDLILVDGGKGHVSAVKEVLDRMDIDIPVFGMVKDARHRTRAVTHEGGEIAISATKPVFKLITAVQNEVHRFSVEYQRNLHRKNTIKPELAEIGGIGEKRQQALLRHFKSIKAIKEASLEELLSVKGMTKPAAEAVYNYYNGKSG